MQSIQQFEEWGYQLVHLYDVVKMTANQHIIKGYGYYFQHSKETMMIFKKVKEGREMMDERKINKFKKKFKTGFHHLYTLSQKPTKIVEKMRNELVGFDSEKEKTVELFARNYSIFENATFIGQQLYNEKHIRAIYIRRDKVESRFLVH